MQTLGIEGEKYNVRVNCLAPTAATAMTDGVLAADALAHLAAEAVSPGLLALVGDDAPTRAILCAGAGHFAAAHVTLTGGLYVGQGEGAAQRVVAEWDRVSDRGGEIVPRLWLPAARTRTGKAGLRCAAGSGDRKNPAGRMDRHH